MTIDQAMLFYIKVIYQGIELHMLENKAYFCKICTDAVKLLDISNLQGDQINMVVFI